MARLRQQYPQSYNSSGNVSAEFENIVRYLNAAELGNKTVGELLQVLFNNEGQFVGPFELRKNKDSGLEFRVGQYSNPDDGWRQIAALSELRGEPGIMAGTIGAPIFYGRVDYEGDGSTSEFDYAHNETDDILVFKDGLLKTPVDDYNTSTTGGSTHAGSVTTTSPLAIGEKVTFWKVRTSAITGYRRVDILTTATQAVFPFEFDEDTQLLVARNGILQGEGGSIDYTRQPEANTITFNTPLLAGNKVTILTVENVSAQAVTGLMLEQHYTDLASGLILLNKIQIDDNQIPQSKINNLTVDLASRAVLHIGPLTPDNAELGHFWLDTSRSPNRMNFYDGVRWLATSPESSLPTFGANNANEFIGVNGTGTGLEYRGIDLSSVIPKTQKGASNGVASLDSSGRIPSIQLPEVLSQTSLPLLKEGQVADGDYAITRIFQQKIRIEALSLRLTSGTCTVQLTVNGVAVGNEYAVTATPSEFILGTKIELDASNTSKAIGIKVSNASAANILDMAVSISNLAV